MCGTTPKTVKRVVTATVQSPRTYVLVDTDVVVGYFAIAPHYLERGDAPPQARHGSAAPDPGDRARQARPR